MLKQEFKDKVIAIFGASIDEHGYYMDNMRRFIANQTEKCYIVNRSIGGNYAMLACNMVEDEIDTLNPDVVFVHFGTNDIGVYNYNANVPETEEVIAKREASVKKYFKYMRQLVSMLKERGKEVYIMTPVCTDELIFEKEDIETVKDNVDKAKYLKSDFYCRASMRNVNNAFREQVVPELKNIAKEFSVGLIDTFSETHKEMLNGEGMFNEDGIHYSQKGHVVLAKILLNYLGYENIPDSFDIKNDVCNVINRLEQLERHIQFFRRWIFYPLEHKPFADVNTEEDVKRKIRELVKENECSYSGFALVADCYYDSLPIFREKCVKLIKRL